MSSGKKASAAGTSLDSQSSGCRTKLAGQPQERRAAPQAQIAMQRRFIDEVERLTGRGVLAFISNQHVAPDIEVEIFVLAPAAQECR